MKGYLHAFFRSFTPASQEMALNWMISILIICALLVLRLFSKMG